MYTIYLKNTTTTMSCSYLKYDPLICFTLTFATFCSENKSMQYKILFEGQTLRKNTNVYASNIEYRYDR